MRYLMQNAVVLGLALLSPFMVYGHVLHPSNQGLANAEADPIHLFTPEGCVNGNCHDGYGTYIYPNGNRYVGEFLSGKPNGKGILYCANGNKYIGHWKDNMQQGEGKFSFSEGHEYFGQFQRSQFHGKGIMRYANGDEYNGDWQSNKPEGNGVYKFHTGDRYEGQFQQGRFNGQGTLFYVNGARYIGGWLDNLKHGNGLFYDEYGKAVSGQWVRGKSNVALPGKEASPELETVGKSEPPIEEESPNFDPTVKVWAVVAGVASYQHMPALRYTDDDAYQFYAFLKSPEGGALPDNQLRVLVDDNATRDNLLEAMRSIFYQADENDVVLFYFSGHGIEGAFVPVDFDGYGHRLEHSEIRHILEKSHAKQKLVLGDACHSGSLIGGQFTPDMLAAKKPSVGDMLSKYYKAFDDCENGTALFMSSKGAEVSLEDTGLRSGVFSHFLIRGLKGEADADGDEIVNIAELFSFVKAKVANYTAGAQTPVLTGKYDGKLPVAVVRN